MIEFLKFIYPYTKEHKKNFIGSVLFVLLGVFTQIAVPLAINIVIDDILPLKVESEIYFAFIIILILSILDYIANLGMRSTGVNYSRDVMESIRRDIYKKLHEQELEYYSKETVGQLMARTVDEVYSLQEILTWGWRIIIFVITISTGVFIVMFITSPILAIIFALTYPILLYVLKKTTNKNAQIFYGTRLKFGDLADTMAENLSGIKTVKSFGREQEQIKLFKEKNDEYIASAYDQILVKSYLQPGMIALYSIAVVTFLIAGGFFLESRVISAGTFVAFMLLILRLSQQTRFLGDLGINILIADSAAKRLNEVLRAPLVLEDDKEAEMLNNITGLIEFKNVTFKYPGNEYKALENVDLIIKPGEKIALLGPTGAGKTTLVNLIPRFYDPTEGTILIDNKDIKHVSRKSLRQFIQIVHQDNFLYTITLSENISFGKPESDLEEIIYYAEASQIHTFIDSLDNKYETIVGERGVTLSGGQRQRTTIARGLIIRPKIIIFDDSVSAIDPETEAKIQETISKIDEDITLIVISQRPSSLKFVDRIIVLDEGHIIQQGSHNELMKEEEGLYRRFVNSVKRQVKFIDWDESISESTSSSNIL
jgi:ABC-type multidrug transport system fused ATPase/permease subunit